MRLEIKITVFFTLVFLTWCDGLEWSIFSRFFMPSSLGVEMGSSRRGEPQILWWPGEICKQNMEYVHKFTYNGIPSQHNVCKVQMPVPWGASTWMMCILDVFAVFFFNAWLDHIEKIQQMKINYLNINDGVLPGNYFAFPIFTTWWN